MVRILKVTNLEIRKQLLLKRSELYRQTMAVELANIKFSVAVWQRKFRMAKSASLLVAAVAGFFLMRKRGSERPPDGEGLFAKLRSGMKFFGMSWPLVRSFFNRSPAAGENDGE